jgi:hypothetical protein
MIVRRRPDRDTGWGWISASGELPQHEDEWQRAREPQFLRNADEGKQLAESEQPSSFSRHNDLMTAAWLYRHHFRTVTPRGKGPFTPATSRVRVFQ